MSPIIYNIITFSNTITAVILFLRIFDIDRRYLSFAFLTWIACGNDTLSYILAIQGIFTIVNNNVYVLLESIVILLFFKNFKVIERNATFLLTVIFSMIVWMVETTYRGINQFSVVFRIYYSLVTVILSINFINRILTDEKRSIFKNASFLLCVAFILYFTLKALVNSFWIYGFTKSQSFLRGIQNIMMYTNLFVNIIYALAALWIPKRQTSILQF